ncbi:MAG: hypothetical protein ACK5MY_07380 [Jhaorihella sp.]
MIARNHLIVKVFLPVLALCPQLSIAEEFTSSDVLKWDQSSQNALFQASIVMTNIIATRTGQHDHILECINEWYGTAELQARRHNHIREVLANYPDHHPQGIILAVIEKACGRFDGS